MDKGGLRAKIENLEYGNIKEENKVHLALTAIHVICPPVLFINIIHIQMTT